MVLRSLLVLGCLFGVGCASAPKPAPSSATAAPAPESSTEQAPPAAAEHTGFLSPAEIMQRLESSKVQYRLEPKDSPPGGWADALWPMRVAPVQFPRVVVEGGRRVIQAWPVNAQAEALLNQGEEHYQAHRYAEAAKLYAQAVELCPDCYLALAYLGDAKLFAGDMEGALADYQKAAKINPDDYRLYYFEGSALARMGRLTEAREAFAQSLVLNPRNPILRQFFRQNPGLGMVVEDDVLVPRGFAHEEGKDVVVEFDPDYGSAWLAFANCKALWLGEPSHRQEMTGTTEHHFTSVEETECLASAAMVHAAQHEKNEQGPTDPSLDQLMEIIGDGMVNELILFEIAARVHPQYTLTLDEEARQRLKDYVLQYVLLSARGL